MEMATQVIPILRVSCFFCIHQPLNMSKESLVKVSPHLETKALSILNVKNPLDSPDFDPAQYLNKLFPTGIH